MDAQLSSDEILRITRGHVPAATYPNGEFASGLKTIRGDDQRRSFRRAVYYVKAWAASIPMPASAPRHGQPL